MVDNGVVHAIVMQKVMFLTTPLDLLIEKFSLLTH
jgi:hypothetical protein